MNIILLINQMNKESKEYKEIYESLSHINNDKVRNM
jgi:hypothetical protein